jgi:hypothetical protein
MASLAERPHVALSGRVLLLSRPPRPICCQQLVSLHACAVVVESTKVALACRMSSLQGLADVARHVREKERRFRVYKKAPGFRPRPEQPVNQTHVQPLHLELNCIL